jgi:hypothetical protein
LLGAAAGALSAGRIADRYGRLRVMQIAAVLFLLSALGAGFANNLAVLIVFRIIGGLGVGIASAIAPAYIAEIAPASPRTAEVAAAAGHRDRHLHLAPGRLSLRDGGRRRDRDDLFGRKPLLIIGSIGMTITLAMMSFDFGVARTVTDAAAGCRRTCRGGRARRPSSRPTSTS